MKDAGWKKKTKRSFVRVKKKNKKILKVRLEKEKIKCEKQRLVEKLQKNSRRLKLKEENEE